MSAATLTTSREQVHRTGGGDEVFIDRALAGRYGTREADAAAEAVTTAQSMPFPDEHDFPTIADLIVTTLNTWESEDEEVPF